MISQFHCCTVLASTAASGGTTASDGYDGHGQYQNQRADQP